MSGEHFTNSIFSSLLHNLEQGVIIESTRRKIIFINDTLHKILPLQLETSEALHQKSEKIHADISRCLPYPEHFQERTEQLFEKGLQEGDSDHLTLSDKRMIERQAVPLKDESGELLAVAWIFKDITNLQNMEEQMRILSSKDSYSIADNRQRFMEELDRNMALSKRYERPLSLLMIEILNLEPILSQYGRMGVRELLQTTSSLINGIKREADILGSWTTGELVLLLPETNQENALNFTERLKTELIRTKTPELLLESVCCFGISQWDKQDKENEFLTRCDRALHQAKKDGANKVCVY